MLLLSFDSLDRSRPTKDIDFLARGFPISVDNIKSIIEEIFNSSGTDDAVVFDASSISIEQIAEEQEYVGFRVFFIAKLINTRIKNRLHLDIGVGDSIVPSPVEMEYPVLLDFEAPQIIAYSKETIIAEKLET